MLPTLGLCPQTRALMTYFRRIYHPFLLGQPSMHTTAAGSLMLWTHRHPDGSQTPAEHAEHAVLDAAVIIPSLAGLAEAVSAVEGLITKQGVLLAKGATMPVDSMRYLH